MQKACAACIFIIIVIIISITRQRRPTAFSCAVGALVACTQLALTAVNSPLILPVVGTSKASLPPLLAQTTLCYAPKRLCTKMPRLRLSWFLNHYIHCIYEGPWHAATPPLAHPPISPHRLQRPLHPPACARRAACGHTGAAGGRAGCGTVPAAVRPAGPALCRRRERGLQLAGAVGGRGGWIRKLGAGAVRPAGQKSVRATQMGAASCCEVEGGDKCA